MDTSGKVGIWILCGSAALFVVAVPIFLIPSSCPPYTGECFITPTQRDGVFLGLGAVGMYVLGAVILGLAAIGNAIDRHWGTSR